MTGAPAALGVYIHWPYCARVCPYCDFNVVRDRGKKAEQADLVEAIARLPPLHAAALSQSLAHIAGELAPEGAKPVFAGCAGCRHLEAKGEASRCRNFGADLSGEETALACVAHSPD